MYIYTHQLSVSEVNMHYYLHLFLDQESVRTPPSAVRRSPVSPSMGTHPPSMLSESQSVPDPSRPVPLSPPPLPVPLAPVTPQNKWKTAPTCTQKNTPTQHLVVNNPLKDKEKPSIFVPCGDEELSIQTLSASFNGPSHSSDSSSQVHASTDTSQTGNSGCSGDVDAADIGNTETSEGQDNTQ